MKTTILILTAIAISAVLPCCNPMPDKPNTERVYDEPGPSYYLHEREFAGHKFVIATSVSSDGGVTIVEIHDTPEKP